jgi:uncharacterized protein (TIGR00730 family)
MPHPTELRTVTVFCGSSVGIKPNYAERAKELGAVLAKEGIKLVYGGGVRGLMGTLANSVLEHGGTVTGVIPQHLVENEVAHWGLTDLRIVRSMHERKYEMAEMADGFIAMPGGMGTLDEFFEVLTWSQLGIHNKPCGFLDVEGYYNLLESFLDHMVDQGFVKKQDRELVYTSERPDELLNMMRSYVPQARKSWIMMKP